MDHPEHPTDPSQRLRERLALRFVRETPFLPEATDLGVATSAVVPWPHQLRTVREATRRYPESFLFCDEVGLGKTIEAGLALRQLVISGRVERALVLVPKSLLRQWQEELWEKLALDVPRFEDGKLIDVFGRRRDVSAGRNPWDAVPRVLASSQLARRRDRRDELLAAEPWDLIIVDEAHHARRRGFASEAARPNRLLELIAGTPSRPGLKDRTRALYLLTATPMQIHPVEVWDLLKLLGLGGRWGAREESFLDFFRELRKPFEERDWQYLLAMLADHLEHRGETEPRLRAFVGRPPVELDEEERAALDRLLRRHTPLRTFAWRATRDHLRAYRRRGLLPSAVPERRPENVWVTLSAGERELYDRIERYLSEFYQRYEARRPGLGFVMTVYRRRLTSSFHAIRRSLERRRRLVRSGRPGGLFADAELPDGELPEEIRDEARYLDVFVDDLRALAADSKLEQLRRDLAEVFTERDAVLIFTQYTDTMDYLRDALRGELGGPASAAVACYSGRGGERWDGEAWAACDKESLKQAFRDREVRLLICTEAACEGLNLQTCGVLINYDVPWNPMRVEQRIGRIDRIGQVHPEVWVRNYFYRDTVEAVIYQRLADRIRWFEDVVGTLEPILHRVGEGIRHVAMLPGHRRARALEEEVLGLRRELDVRAPEVVDWMPELEAPAADEAAVKAPLSWREVEATVTGAQALSGSFETDADLAGAWRLSWRGNERRVTFSPELFDAHPYSLELLTWGTPLFDELLDAGLAESAGDAGETSDEPCGVGLYRTSEPLPVSLFLTAGATPIRDLAELDEAAAADRGRWREAEEGAASVVFSRARARVLRAMTRTEERRRRARRRALAQAARQVLVRSALVELARARAPGLFDEPLGHGFGAEAVRALAVRGAPFAELLAIAESEPGGGLEARADDPFYLAIAGRSERLLERRRSALAAEAERLVEERAALEQAAEAARLATREPSATGILERRWFPLAPAGGAGESLPFQALDASEVEPFVTAVPLYDDLATAAARAEDAAGDPQADERHHPGDYRWVALDGLTRAVPRPGLFVARVTGKAMSPRIPDGAWCLFRFGTSAPPDGKIVLVRHPEIRDPELGGNLTLRTYEPQVERFADGSWQLREVVLRPSSPAPSCEPTVLRDVEDGELRVIAEWLAVLG